VTNKEIDDLVSAARCRAEARLKPGASDPTRVVTRENAINEEHVALDVIELLDIIENLQCELIRAEYPP
jgi:hypothetical protein